MSTTDVIPTMLTAPTVALSEQDLSKITELLSPAQDGVLSWNVIFLGGHSIGSYRMGILQEFFYGPGSYLLKMGELSQAQKILLAPFHTAE